MSICNSKENSKLRCDYKFEIHEDQKYLVT